MKKAGTDRTIRSAQLGLRTTGRPGETDASEVTGAQILELLCFRPDGDWGQPGRKSGSRRSPAQASSLRPISHRHLKNRDFVRLSLGRFRRSLQAATGLIRRVRSGSDARIGNTLPGTAVSGNMGAEKPCGCGAPLASTQTTPETLCLRFYS